MRKPIFKDGDWTLRSDSRQYILENPKGKISWYYATIDGAVQDMLDIKTKEFATADKRQTLESMLDAIQKADQWIRANFSNVKLPRKPRFT